MLAGGVKRWGVLIAAVVSAAAWAGAPGGAVGAGRPIGDVAVFATLPYPGQPGGIAVDQGVAYVDTFAFVVRPTDPADDVFSYDTGTGAPRQDRPNPIAVTRARPVAVMGLSGMATGPDGALYVVDMNGRILRIDPRSGTVTTYATFPASAGGPVTTMPLDMVFDGAGNAYVTDIGGAPVIWRIPPGGGQAAAWFVDPRIAGAYTEGGGGIRIDPSGTHLYFIVVASFNSATPAKGVVFRLPLASPTADALQVFHAYGSMADAPPLGEGPLGIAFGASGKLYVAMPGVNAVSVLRPDGSEERRMTLPYTAQFVALRGNGSLLVTTWGDVNNGPWPVLDVFVNDVAPGPPPTPVGAGAVGGTASASSIGAAATAAAAGPTSSTTRARAHTATLSVAPQANAPAAALAAASAAAAPRSPVAPARPASAVPAGPAPGGRGGGARWAAIAAVAALAAVGGGVAGRGVARRARRLGRNRRD